MAFILDLLPFALFACEPDQLNHCFLFESEPFLDFVLGPFDKEKHYFLLLPASQMVQQLGEFRLICSGREDQYWQVEVKYFLEVGWGGFREVLDEVVPHEVVQVRLRQVLVEVYWLTFSVPE